MTIAFHAGGREFDSRRPRQKINVCRILACLKKLGYNPGHQMPLEEIFQGHFFGWFYHLGIFLLNLPFFDLREGGQHVVPLFDTNTSILHVGSFGADVKENSAFMY
jgi:hypothetical protein